MKRRILLLVALVLTALIHTAHAEQITYVLAGTGGSGIFAGNPYSGASFIVTGIADTNNTTSIAGFPAIFLTSLTYNITGVTTGAATAIDSNAIINMNSGGPGLVNVMAFADIDNTTGTYFSAASIGDWPMDTNIGPLPSIPDDSTIVNTDQGGLELSNWSSATFTATVASSASAPEPSTLALTLLGLALGGSLFQACTRRSCG